MNALLRPAIAMVGLLTVLLGLALPLGFTYVAGAVLPGPANGSLITRDGRVVGSALIGQNFAEDRYFQGRPSATAPDPYNAAAGAAANLGPTSQALLDAIKERVAGATNVPADAVTTSASGLDPHITPENATRQVARVATARNIPEARIAALVAQSVEGPELGLLGTRRVNVLRLNLALDALR